MRCINDIELHIFQVDQWAINHVDFIDEFGDTIPHRDDGSMFLPEDIHGEFAAMSLVKTTGMSYEALCSLRFDEFRRMAALARANAWTPATRNKHDKYL